MLQPNSPQAMVKTALESANKSRLLARRAEIIETPVQFIPMSSGQVRRTTVGEGLRSLAMMLRWRLAGESTPPPRQGR